MSKQHDYDDMSTADLLVAYNETSGVRPLKSWKQSKTKLVKRVCEAKLQQATGSSARKTGGSTKKTAAMTQRARSITTASIRPIREAALELLCEVVRYEDRNRPASSDNIVEADVDGARSVGVPYDEIIDAIRDEFPDCETTVACLRWYAVKVRVEEFGYEGLRLPQRRPRVKVAKK